MKRLLYLSLMIAFAVACQGNVNDDPAGEDNAVRPEYEFLTGSGDEALTKAEQENVERINDFAFNLGNRISEAKGNKGFVYSPVSMAFTLGMLSEGAAGQTREEICRALGYGMEGQQEVNEFCRKLMLIAGNSLIDGEELEIANAAVINTGFRLLESYRKSAKNYYDAEIAEKDFTKENVAGYINDWASEKTHERITHVIDEVPASTPAVFINALYFKASWMYPFADYLTRDRDFTGADGVVRQEKMMARTDNMLYSTGDGFSMVTLPYGKESFNPEADQTVQRSGNYAMSLLLPDEGVSTGEILSRLDGVAFSRAKSSGYYPEVILTMPRFEAELDDDLKAVLEALGIRSMFGNADFSAMTQMPVFVDQVKQVANIAVDEYGTEAAAVTVAMMATDPGPGAPRPKYVEFRCDRPFIFAITEQTTGAILFLGSYR